MVNLFLELLDIWEKATPDDLRNLFDTSRRPLLTLERIEEMDFSGSISTGKSILEVMGRLGYVEGPSGGDLYKFIRESLGLRDRYRIPLLKWMLKPSLDWTTGNINLDYDSLYVSRETATCPLCASPPGLAIITQDRQLLICCFCRYKWPWRTGICIKCGNDRRELQSFFADESMCSKGERAIACEVCKRYIKTLPIDEKGLPVEPDVEDVITLYLDIIAHERGYKNICE